MFGQVRLMVNDGGNPSLSDMTLLSVNVNRNRFNPVFNQRNYLVTIFEDQPLGVSIEQVTAQDNDTKSPWRDVRYEAMSSTNNGLSFFAVEQQTGVVTVTQSLITDRFSTPSFEVSTHN